MKEKNCLNPKMAAYCRAVRELEDKFYSLELNHILWRYNEAADTLAKTASNWRPMPSGVFASDQHAPSIRLDEEQPAEPTPQEVI